MRKATKPKPKPKSKRMTLQEQLAAERIRRRRAESALLTANETILAGVEAFRLTRESVRENTLPARPGWSWYDWCVRACGGAPEWTRERTAPEPFRGEVAAAPPSDVSEMERHALHGAALGWPKPGDPAPNYTREVRP